MQKLFFILTLASFVLLLSSCDDDDPVIPNEEEVITTLTYSLVPSGGGATATLRFVDEDGDGGNNPVITTDNLAANTTYVGTLTLLNESETPAEDITVEVEEEGEEHQFFFEADGANLSVSYNDQDTAGNPVGLSTMVTTGDASTGNLTVILRHEPNKSGANVSDGDITNAGGETDIEVTFPITIE